MAGQPEAREFLIQTVLHGMAGRIQVDGAAIVGVMPPFASLPDRDVASVLNYLVALGGSAAKKLKPITTAGSRGRSQRAGDVGDAGTSATERAGCSGKYSVISRRLRSRRLPSRSG